VPNGSRQGEAELSVAERASALLSGIAFPGWARVAFVAAFFLATIGLPLNSPAKFWIALACGIVLLASATRPEPWRYAAAAALAIAAIALKAFVPHTQVEIAHNLYLPIQSERYRALPDAFRAALESAFLRANPLSRGCDPAEELRRRGLTENRPLTVRDSSYRVEQCWRNAILPEHTFAFSGDAFFRDPPEARVVDRLEIDGQASARIAAAYAFNASWYFWRENPNRIAPAWYLAITLPRQLAGSRVCSRGAVYWESERSWLTTGETEICKEVLPVHAGTRIWAFDTGASPALALRLDQSAALVALDASLRAALLGLLASIAWLTLKPDWPRAARATAWCAASVALIASVAPAFFTLPLTVANEHDALVYRGLGYDIAQSAAQGRWTDALRGGEDVFFFMPGMRYFRALELTFFGDTSLATLLAAGLLLPLLWRLAYLALERRGIAFFYVLACLPILSRLCSLAAKGYGEAIGFLALLAGVVVFARAASRAEPREASLAELWMSFALVSVGAWVRPNFALVVAVMALIYLRALAPAVRWRTSALVLSGSLLVLAPALHNLYFGERLVPFTLTLKGDSLRVDLADYAGMLGEWTRGTLGQYSARVAHQLEGWVVPVRWLALLAAFHLLLRRGPGWPPARTLAAVTLAMYLPFLFYFSVTRHIQTADALGLLCALVELQSGFAAWRAAASKRSGAVA
jgi:hypothetical protein